VLCATAARTVSRAAWLVLLPLAPGPGCERDDPAPQSFEAPAEPTKPPDPYKHSPSRFGTVPLHAGFSPDPRVVAGNAVGEVPADSVHRKCRGWISKTPDYLLDASTAFFQLYVLGRSTEDVVLVVRKPDGSVLCNDNRRGTHDPMIRSDFPIGTSQIWVGVQEEGGSASYRLGLSEVKWKSSSIPLPEVD
jgi:hypothetical protein